jgi:hypothetical protein
MLTSFEKNECKNDCITFGDNSQDQVLGFGKIGITTEYSISKVLLVESLDYNLLPLSQFCEQGYNYLFTDKGVTVFRRSDGSFTFKGVLRGKLYLVDFILEEVEIDRCLIAKINMSWLWYRRLAQVDMRNILKLQKYGPCGACQAGKQVGADHHVKNIMTTTRPLEMLHMELFGPIAYISIGGSKYGLIVIDGYFRFTWVFFLQDKSET